MRSPRRPGRKEPHCESCQAAGARSSSPHARDDPRPRRRPAPPSSRPRPPRPGAVHERHRPASNPAAATPPGTRSSGAYGKYQIMPSNWPSWARQYLGNANAQQTPANQEKVAAGKMTSLYHWLGSWRRVAYWWLTGSSTDQRLVDLRDPLRQQGHDATTAAAGGTHRGPSTKAEVRRTALRAVQGHRYTGTWRRARHGGYGGDAVALRRPSRAPARPSRSPAGRSSWNGPIGPTRGKARVYIDGKYVKTVEPRTAARSTRRATLFRNALDRRPARTRS